ncbi:cohesin complex subunit [Capsaspora owczarzaki ATCC 30864]|uniref:Structural maintenance of chromosomes protein n=1 Tax=Capsaspora owczarzaki (strain ATCC 30864) TaxID=595528 RepID=A0A0D2WKF0_CAPO3|nr:cohesin complex subunit [Capsaspora owczarzaki ATCC 30864]KJE90720.1 cohesin complex subunit [Capsaspora owczarzaki ATCC 30864]|eukprot:XP_004364852.2 cohesin complex subunit [Capsaspora owczarzaki ATCC 30864]
MFIKQVTMQGFMSYRDQTIVEPFSPKHNVVVGRNGSGKSSLFLAIRFVLNDLEPPAEETRSQFIMKLLHDGVGGTASAASAMNASVEVCFDNSDSRIPIDSDEVTLRRVIGIKRDDYYIDGKHVVKSDVMNLFESAGFSQANPYYIVQQGKITKLAVQKDADRLQLLKDVAGTSVYDKRREESVKLMDETEGRRGKVDEMLAYIEERLQELEAEKNELKDYQLLDKERRRLEYNIYERELRETREQLEELERTRQAESESNHARHAEAIEVGDKIKLIDREFKALAANVRLLQDEQRGLQDDLQVAIKARAKAELDAKDLVEGVAADKTRKDLLEKDITQLQKLIADREKQLRDTVPKYESVLNQQQALEQQLAESQRRRDDLTAKQGRGAQFATVEERDAWLKQELATLTKSRQEKQKTITSMKTDITRLSQTVESQSGEIDERVADLKKRQTEVESLGHRNAELVRARDDAMNRRKALWQQDASKDAEMENLRADFAKADRNLQGTMSKSLAQAIEAIERIAREKNISGVHGPLIELFQCEEVFHTCVEVTAGNSLFNIVVDNDEIASKLISAMNAEKISGRVTFMPLNRLDPKPVSYPKTKDALPLVDKLQYHPMFKGAIMQIFNKTLICRTMDVASTLAREAKLDCITLEGDQAHRKGALTGGYHDVRTSRLEAMRAKRLAKSKLDSMSQESAKLKRMAASADEEVNKVASETQQSETRRAQLVDSDETLRLELRGLTEARDAARASLEQKQKQLATLEADLATLTSQIDSLKAEVGTQLLSTLNAADQQELRSLLDSIQSLKQQLMTSYETVTQVQSTKTQLESELQQNLKRRRAALEDELRVVSERQRDTLLQTATQTHQTTVGQVTRIQERLAQVEDALTTQNKEEHTLKQQLDTMKDRERVLREALAREGKAIEKILNKRNLLLQRREECTRKIRDLGSLPTEAFDNYQTTPLQRLYELLNKCNENLQKFSHVNKKAVDQYMNFSSQRQMLLERKQDLDKGDQAIKELLESLDHRKDAAIQLTFQQVAKNLTDVFAELVPGGHAKLVMQLKDARELEAEQASRSGDSRRLPPVEAYVGVSIHVSFTGKSSETHLMQQLSGGQKTLVALALIFAIQRCDPAPFYLFDELDQALDETHRTAVAAMIHRLSDRAQFLTTTFKPEMLKDADKVYAVTHRNKVSYIDCVSRAAALDFIAEGGDS